MIKIPDVSFWQDDPTTPLGIDFDVMASQTGAVIVRTGQNSWADNEFKISWHNAKLAGLLRGSYWFFDSRADPKRQAELYIATLGGDLGELPLWCDFEDQYNGVFTGWKHWYTFIERLKVLAPDKQIGIYTGYYYWLDHTAGAPIASKDYFRQFPLWIARYNATEPLTPYPWIDWTLWQYTDNGDGALYGVESGNIDLNYFNGDADKFRQVFGVSIDTPPEIPNEENQMAYKYEYINMVDNMSIRPTQGTANAPTGSLSRNVKGYGNELTILTNGDKWLKIEEGGSAVGWVAVIHQGKPYGVLTVINTTPSPVEPVPPFNLAVDFAWDGTKMIMKVNGIEVLIPPTP